ncbi:MAG TPA: M20 family metallopeptidase [Pyrinomonadaceae bacterium]|jgi:glutamate carboxypeptidase|nr:M20 family metallopeptidase [Pyrinomonadaceae bacterium]
MQHEINGSEAKALRDSIEARRGALLALMRALVETESPSGDVAGSRAVVSLLAEDAKTIDGVTSVERIESPGYGEHLRIRAFDRASDRAGVSDGSILLVGHTDTVHPLGSLAERPWREEGGRIYGPGIFDMKANCTLVLEALRACVANNLLPRRNVVLVLTCDEETGSETGRALIEEEARGACAALVLEPPASGGRVKTARKGTGIFNMEVRGRAAHAGLEPEKGASAILELARQIERLQVLNNPERGTTVNVGVIGGGTRSNVVAAFAHAEIDIRFSTQEDAEHLDASIRQARPFDGRVQISVSGGINRPPLERNDGVVALYQRARSICALLDFELGEASVGGASDGNFIAAMNVPVLDGLGISGDGAHATHEHILTDDIATRGALVAALIATL